MTPAARHRFEKMRRERRVFAGAVGATAAAILIFTLMAIRFAEGRTSPAASASEPAVSEVLAVMPFEEVGPAPTHDAFGVGIADTIISRLSAVADLTVRPMSASLGAIQGGGSALEAARRLDAVAVMVGEYAKKDERFEVRVRLLDTDSGDTLWEHQLDSGVRDLMAVEKQVVDQTIAAMLPHVRNEERARRADPGRRDATAHYLYLLARGKNATWESRPIPEAVELLEHAIRLDPDFAPAQAELATASANMFLGGLSAEPMWVERAVAAGRRAVFLDDGDASAHFALGYSLYVAGDPVGSARETLHALRLDPRHAMALRNLATLVAGAGYAAPVRSLRDAARKADPFIDVGWLDVWLAMIEGNYEHRMAGLRKEIDLRRSAGLSPELPIMQIGYLSFESGDSASGLRYAAMLEEVSANAASADMVHLLALSRLGDAAGMRRLIEKNKAFYTRTWDYCDLIGRALSAMGEKQEALDWLDRSAARGNFDLGTWERSVMLDPLRGDERFEADLAIVRDRTRRIVQLAEFAGYM